MVTVQHITEVLSDVVAPYDVRAAYLFGSFARGEQSSESDIDVRLECGPDIDYGNLLDIQETLEERLGRSDESSRVHAAGLPQARPARRGAPLCGSLSVIST